MSYKTVEKGGKKEGKQKTSYVAVYELRSLVKTVFPLCFSDPDYVIETGSFLEKKPLELFFRNRFFRGFDFGSGFLLIDQKPGQYQDNNRKCPDTDIEQCVIRCGYWG